VGDRQGRRVAAAVGAPPGMGGGGFCGHRRAGPGRLRRGPRRARQRIHGCLLRRAGLRRRGRPAWPGGACVHRSGRRPGVPAGVAGRRRGRGTARGRPRELDHRRVRGAQPHSRTDGPGCPRADGRRSGPKHGAGSSAGSACAVWPPSCSPCSPWRSSGRRRTGRGPSSRSPCSSASSRTGSARHRWPPATARWRPLAGVRRPAVGPAGVRATTPPQRELRERARPPVRLRQLHINGLVPARLGTHRPPAAPVRLPSDTGAASTTGTSRGTSVGGRRETACGGWSG